MPPDGAKPQAGQIETIHKHQGTLDQLVAKFAPVMSLLLQKHDSTPILWNGIVWTQVIPYW